MQLSGQKARAIFALAFFVQCASVNSKEQQVMPGAWRILPANFLPYEKQLHKTSVLPPPPPSLFNEITYSAIWQPMFDRVMDQGELQSPLPSDLIEAILRIEGMFDPTRVGYFGPALRMKIRSGNATMNNVFGDQWMRPTLDPNIHRRLNYIAFGWLNRETKDCSEFRKFRPDDNHVLVDNIDASDCRAILFGRRLQNSVDYALLTEIRPNIPIFASPFPGARFSRADFVKIQRAIAISKLREKNGSKPKYRASAAF